MNVPEAIWIQSTFNFLSKDYMLYAFLLCIQALVYLVVYTLLGPANMKQFEHS